MTYSKFSLALLAMAGALLGASQAHAQYDYLLTEAPVTIQYSLSVPTTQVVPAGGTGARTERTRPTSIPLTPKNFLEELKRSTDLISTETVDGWSVVAVRPVPSDVYYVDARYFFYLVHKTSAGVIDQRVAIPDTKFSFARSYSNYVYTEKYLGSYTAPNAKGTSSNFVNVTYTPNFVRLTPAPAVVYDLVPQESQPDAGILSWANATIAFVSAHEPIFYVVPTSVRLSGVGGLSGQRGPVGGPFTPVQGLVTFTITIGGPRLVPATDYADVPKTNITPEFLFDFPFSTTGL